MHPDLFTAMFERIGRSNPVTLASPPIPPEKVQPTELPKPRPEPSSFPDGPVPKAD